MVIMTKQVSIKESTDKIKGVNVFNGNKSYVQFHPAEDNKGLVFKVNKEYIPVDIHKAFYHKSWRSLRLASCISINGVNERAVKVEHLLSAIYALGIDNLIIELSDGVCPRQNNAATEIIEALQDLRVEGSDERLYLRIKRNLDENKRTVEVNGIEDKLLIQHSDDFVIDYTAFYPHKVIGHQHHRFYFSEENYKEEIMKARGIFFLPKGSRYIVDSFLNKFHGIRDTNALLIGTPDDELYKNIIRPEGIYGKDEFVRHKILDVIGTLALIGKYFKETEFQFNKTGHKFDIYALKTLIERDCFELYAQPLK